MKWHTSDAIDQLLATNDLIDRQVLFERQIGLAVRIRILRLNMNLERKFTTLRSLIAYGNSRVELKGRRDALGIGIRVPYVRRLRNLLLLGELPNILLGLWRNLPNWCSIV